MKRLIFKAQCPGDAKKIVEFWNKYCWQFGSFNGNAEVYIIGYNEIYSIIEYAAFQERDVPDYDSEDTITFKSIPAFMEFPEEIKAEMIRHSKYQSPIPFTIYPSTDAAKGGFDWDATDEGWNFWDKVITKEDFDLFYKHFNLEKNESRLCNKETPVRGGSEQNQSGIRSRFNKARVTVKPLGYQRIAGRG